MVSFRTVKTPSSITAKLLAFAAMLLMSSVLANAGSEKPEISSIADLEEASLVTVSGGYDQGFRRGMKLLAHNQQGIAAELIVLDVTASETQTLIIELFGQAELMQGDPVTIKTINFAATWK